MTRRPKFLTWSGKEENSLGRTPRIGPKREVGRITLQKRVSNPCRKHPTTLPISTVESHIVEFVCFVRVVALNAEREGIKGVNARNSLGSKTGPRSQQGRLGLRPLDHQPHQPEGDHQRLEWHNRLEITTSCREEDASFVWRLRRKGMKILMP